MSGVMARECRWMLLSLVCLLCGSRSTATGELTMDEPLGQDRADELVVEKGAEFSVTCRGDSEIDWAYNHYKPLQDEEESQKEVQQRDEYGQVVSTLTVRGAYYMDTGDFTCFPRSEDRDSPSARSLYVYVKDPENLLVVNDTFILLTATQFSDVVIPCRPTDPGLQVKLMKDNERVEVGRLVNYDSRTGFTLSQVSPRLTGDYLCLTFLPNGTEVKEKDVGNFHLIVMQSDHLERPHIDVTPHTYVKGQNITLKCSIHYNLGTFHNLNWTSPHPPSLQLNRVELNYSLTDNDEGHVNEVSLVIHKVSKEDEGQYTCKAIDGRGLESANTYQLKLSEGNSLNLSLRGKEVVVEPGAPSAQLVVEIASHPPPIKVKWYNNNNELIVTESSDMFVVNTTKDKSETKLTIKKPNVFQSGIYRLTVSNGVSERTINIKVTVKGLPELRLNGDKPEDFYLVGQEHIIDCEVMGFPMPTVTWSLTYCDNYPNCETQAHLIPRGNYSEVEDDNLCVLNSSVKLFSSRTITVVCEACNTVGCNNASINFLASDVEGGFNLEGPELVVERDNVTLTCTASKYTYKKDLQLLYKDNEQFVPITGLQIVSGETTHSYVQKLSIPRVNKTSSGVYLCRAMFLHKRQENSSMNYILHVNSLEKPVMEVKGSKTRVRTGTRVEWECSAKGMPPPTLTWYMNGEDIAELNRVNMRLHQDNRTLEVQVGLEDDGRYECVAKNKAGQDTVTYELNVIDKPNKVLIIFFMYILPVLVIVAAIIALLYARRTYKLRKEIKELKAAGLLNFEVGQVECLNPELDVGEQADLLPYNRDKWEFPRDKLKLGKQLGSGAFGVVMKAEAYELEEPGVSTTVAVKMVKRNSQVDTIKALASELKIMIHLGKHLNVVNVLGACTGSLNKRELLVLVEYCQYGNLHSYLLKHRGAFISQVNTRTGQFDPVLVEPASPMSKYADSRYGGTDMSNGRASALTSAALSQATDTTLVMSDMSEVADPDSNKQETPLDEDGYLMQRNHEWRNSDRGDYKNGLRPVYTQDLICWGFQIARGMEYLASRKVLHGDLAARNVLLADDNIVKICDFGLSKSMYRDSDYRKKGDGPLPVKWMALESIRDRVFSTQSDVWAYGVTLWELFSLACTPYPGMQADERLFMKLAQGYRMDQPKYATNQVYQVMEDCWHMNPHSRPSFVELTERMGAMLEDTVRTHYVDLNDPFLEENSTIAAQQDYLSMLRPPTYTNWVPGNDYVLPSSPNRGKEDAYELTPMLRPALTSDSESAPSSPIQLESPKGEDNIPDSPDGSPISKPKGNNYMNIVQFLGFSNPSYQNVGRPNKSPYANVPPPSSHSQR